MENRKHSCEKRKDDSGSQDLTSSARKRNRNDLPKRNIRKLGKRKKPNAEEKKKDQRGDRHLSGTTGEKKKKALKRGTDYHPSGVKNNGVNTWSISMRR